MWKVNIVSWRNNFVVISRRNHQSFRLMEIRLKNALCYEEHFETFFISWKTHGPYLSLYFLNFKQFHQHRKLWTPWRVLAHVIEHIFVYILWIVNHLVINLTQLGANCYLIVTFTHCSSVSIVDYEQVNVSLEKHKIIQPLIQEIWSKDPVSLIKETCSQPWLNIFIIKGSLKKKLHKKSRLTITWVKVFKNGPSKICGRQPFIIKNFKWYQGCLPQILLGPFLKTLTYLIQQILLIK